MAKVNEVNFFPDFVPLKKGDEQWEDAPVACHGCQKDFHFILLRPVHCTVCGLAFCKHCCHDQAVYNHHNACSGCVANAMMMIKERYEKKRMHQVQSHHEKYHHDEAQARKQNQLENTSEGETEVDKLYGRAFEALQTKNLKTAPIITDTSTIGVNDINFFPNFKPVMEGDEKWQTESFSHCPECHEEYHPILRQKWHCANCGEIFCSYCCKPQRVFNNHRACGACVAHAMIMIKQKYDKKRTEQLKKHHEIYHREDASKKEKTQEQIEQERKETDDLYGRAYEALLAKMKMPTASSSTVVAPAEQYGGVAINEVNFFPDFKPLEPGDDRWEDEADEECPSCKSSWHPLTHRQTHCTVCGFIFCNHCAVPQQVYNNHIACGGCVANAMMMIKERYDAKRKAQLKAFNEKYKGDKKSQPREDVLK